MNQSTKIPGPQIAYTDLVDHCMAEAEDTFDAFPLRPSAVGKCERALAFELYEWQGRGEFPKERKDPATKRLLSLGSSVEYHEIKNFDLIQKASKNFKIRYKQQSITLFRLGETGPLIEGSCDLSVMNRDNNQGGVLDIKSKKDSWSSGYKSAWDESIAKFNSMTTLTKISDTGWYAQDLAAFLQELNDTFFEDNFLQCNLYATAPWAVQHGIDHGSIIRYNKNSSVHLEIRFAPNQGLFDAAKSKFTRVYDMVTATKSVGELKDLPCSFVFGSLKAAYCPCRIYAGENQKDALTAWYGTLPKKEWPVNSNKLGRNIEKLFREYEELSLASEKLEQVELEIAKALQEAQVHKIRLSNDHVYELKALKTGGPSNGPRLALRRSKA